MQKDIELGHNELLFLWLKDDKTFTNGFQLNFTNKYRLNFCNNVLMYEDEKIKDNNQNFNFFANNININMIVGKNGTGKSTILKYLHSILQKDKQIMCEYLLIFSNGRYLSSNQLEIDNKTNIDLKCDNEDKKLTYRSKHYDSEKNFNDFFTYNNLNISPKSINKFVHESVIYDDKNKHKFNLFKFTADKIKLRILNYEELEIKCITTYFDTLEKYLVEEGFGISEKLNIFISYLRKFGDKYVYFIFNETLDSPYLIDEIYKIDYEDYEDYEYFEDDEIVEKIFEDLRIEYSIKFYDDLIKFKYDYNINSNSFTEFDFNKDVINLLLVSSKIFDIDYIDKNGRSYKDLSYGEKTAFGLFVNIYEFMLDRAFKTCILLLDEPDISLHPQWQKQFINDIVENFKDKENFLNIIITTHSPILLSDIPSNNITYLNKDEDKNLTFIDKKNDLTFGASIYSLLNDSFYMEEGTSGDFAKEKINKLINDLKTKENELLDKNELLYTINQIGEPYLQYKIKNMFDEKFEKEIKYDKLENLKRERDNLDREIEKLEKN